MKRLAWLVLSVMFPAALWAAAPYDAAVRAIDQEALSVDKHLADYTRTTQNDCTQEACTATELYWDAAGKIRKVVQASGSASGAGSIVGRFYKDCHLFLVRTAPSGTDAVKNPKSVERFYFRKEKLIRIVFGDEIQAFGKDQTAYYERTLRADPQHCSIDPR